MANASILSAFERMWYHIALKFNGTVSADTEQTLTEDQKAQARTNIGIQNETWTFELEDGTIVEKKVMIV